MESLIAWLLGVAGGFRKLLNVLKELFSRPEQKPVPALTVGDHNSGSVYNIYATGNIYLQPGLHLTTGSTLSRSMDQTTETERLAEKGESRISKLE